MTNCKKCNYSNVNEDDYIVITWHIDDILHLAPTLTKEKARDILSNVERKHDAFMGISWDTLQCHIDDFEY